MNKIW